MGRRKTPPAGRPVAGSGPLPPLVVADVGFESRAV